MRRPQEWSATSSVDGHRMRRRRELMLLLGSVAASWPLAGTRAQQKAMPMIGFLGGASSHQGTKISGMRLTRGNDRAVQHHRDQRPLCSRHPRGTAHSRRADDDESVPDRLASVGAPRPAATSMASSKVSASWTTLRGRTSSLNTAGRKGASTVLVHWRPTWSDARWM
jgi:hypothetical protein